MTLRQAIDRGIFVPRQHGLSGHTGNCRCPKPKPLPEPVPESVVVEPVDLWAPARGA